MSIMKSAKKQIAGGIELQNKETNKLLRGKENNKLSSSRADNMKFTASVFHHTRSPIVPACSSKVHSEADCITLSEMKK